MVAFSLDTNYRAFDIIVSVDIIYFRTYSKNVPLARK